MVPRLTIALFIPLLLQAPGAGRAGNSIFIDAGTEGSVSSIAIIQDPTPGNATNTVAGSGGAETAFTVKGAWRSVSVNQAGAGNSLQGSIKTSATVPGANDFIATYSGGNNTHTVRIGDTSAPASVRETVNVHNTATSANTIGETLDTPGALEDTLTLHGTANTVTNTVDAGGNITLNQIIGGGAYGTANGNTVLNAASSLGGAYAVNLTISGDGATAGSNNLISNNATGSGDRGFTTTLNGTSDSSFYANLAGGSGTVSQSASVTADSSTQARYAAQSDATGTSSVTTQLNGVLGGVYVQQTGSNNTAQLTVTNTSNVTLGTLAALPAGSSLSGLPANYFGSGNANPGVAVFQSGSSGTLTAAVTAYSSGYTVAITSSGTFP